MGATATVMPLPFGERVRPPAVVLVPRSNTGVHVTVPAPVSLRVRVPEPIELDPTKVFAPESVSVPDPPEIVPLTVRTPPAGFISVIVRPELVVPDTVHVLLAPKETGAEMVSVPQLETTPIPPA